MSLRTVIPITFGVLALTSCAVGPKYETPVTKADEDWKLTATPQISQSPMDNAWWKSFNDPVLEQLIALAYKQNLTLQVAGVRIMEARALLGIAVGSQYPQMQQAFASATRVGLSDNVVNNASFDRHFWDAQVGFDVAWELDFWNKYGGGVTAQRAALLSSVADYQSALVSLSAEVARTYTAVRSFETLLEQDRRNLALQQETFRITGARYRNGATSELDVTQARTLLESTRAMIPQHEISLAQAKNALAILVGQPAGSIQALLQGPRPIPTAPAKVAVGIPADVLRRRPDVRAAELMARARLERIGVAKADLYPSISIGGTVGYQATSGNSTAESVNLVSPSSLFFAIGPRLNWPFFNYGRIENAVRVEDAKFQEAALSYKNSVLKASQEVDDGIVGFIKATEATTAQENAVTSARRSVEIANIQYRDGAVDFQRVLDAQRSQLAEENNLVNLRATAATNVISLYKALGGGWEMSVGQPFIPDAIRTQMEKRTNWGDVLSTQPTTSPAKDSPPPSGS